MNMQIAGARSLIFEGTRPNREPAATHFESHYAGGRRAKGRPAEKPARPESALGAAQLSANEIKANCRPRARALPMPRDRPARIASQCSTAAEDGLPPGLSRGKRLSKSFLVS